MAPASPRRAGKGDARRVTASLRWTSVEELPTTASRRTGITPRTRGYSLRTDGRPPTPGAPSGPITARINPRPRRPVMGTIVISGTVVLVVLGFDNHLYWLAAVAVLFLYVQYGRGGSSPSSPTGDPRRGPRPRATARTATAVTSRPGGSAATAASAPSSPAVRSARRASETGETTSETTGSPGGPGGPGGPGDPGGPGRRHRPGAPHTGNQRLRSGSIRRSPSSAALTRSSSALSRRCPSPGSGANG